MRNAGFKALAQRLCVGHAYAHPVDWGGEVEVFGRKVKPGQLIHADQHGFMAIEEEDEEGLLEAARFMDTNECETFLPLARSAAGKSTEQLLADYNEAALQFGGNVRENVAKLLNPSISILVIKDPRQPPPSQP